MWDNIKTILQSITNVAVSVATSAEKTVKLYENEVDNLSEEQMLRLDAAKAKRTSYIKD